MVRSAALRPGALPSALAQTTAGLAAHAAASGCLPSAATLLLAGPTALLSVLVVGAVLPARPLLRLAGGQLAVHAVLALAACAGAGHLLAAGATSLAMTVSHVLALVACRAGLERCATAALRSAATALAPRCPQLPALPVWPAVLPVPVAAPSPAGPVLVRAPVRGPPVALLQAA